MGISKFCGISIYSTIGSLKIQGRISSSLISKISKIVDFAIPGDARVKDKELEKIENYQHVDVIGKQWKLKKVAVMRIVIAALGAVSDMFVRKGLPCPYF